jgi:hypothetical protein
VAVEKVDLKGAIECAKNMIKAVIRLEVGNHLDGERTEKVSGQGGSWPGAEKGGDLFDDRVNCVLRGTMSKRVDQRANGAIYRYNFSHSCISKSLALSISSYPDYLSHIAGIVF